MIKNPWDIVPYIKSEGIFSGTVIRLRRMLRADGCQIMLRLDRTPISPTLKMPVRDTHLPETLAHLIYRDEMDTSGSVKIGLYFSNWKYADDLEDESDIEDLLTHIRPGQHITFRMSKNWRGKKYYCRYIRNDNTREWSGWENESDWRQTNHPHPPYPKSGTAILSISHAEHITDDFGRDLYSLEVTENTREHFGTYRCLAPAGTDAFQIIREMENTDYQNRKFFCTVTYDNETGTAYMEKLESISKSFLLAKKDRPKSSNQKRGQKKNDAPKYDYAFLKKIADGFPKLPNDEYEKSNGIYQATVIDSQAIDYRKSGSIGFIPLRLQDGREIMPSWQSRQKKTEIKNGKMGNHESWNLKTDLLKNRRLLFPGLEVTAHFSPGHKGGYMMLRAMWTETDERTLKKQKKQYFFPE